MCEHAGIKKKGSDMETIDWMCSFDFFFLFDFQSNFVQSIPSPTRIATVSYCDVVVLQRNMKSKG